MRTTLERPGDLEVSALEGLAEAVAERIAAKGASDPDLPVLIQLEQFAQLRAQRIRSAEGRLRED